MPSLRHKTFIVSSSMDGLPVNSGLDTVQINSAHDSTPVSNAIENLEALVTGTKMQMAFHQHNIAVLVKDAANNAAQIVLQNFPRVFFNALYYRIA